VRLFKEVIAKSIDGGWRPGPVLEAIAPFAPTLLERFNTVFLKVANLKVSLNTLAAPGVGN
jgi:hypothetical protein